MISDNSGSKPANKSAPSTPELERKVSMAEPPKVRHYSVVSRDQQPQAGRSVAGKITEIN